MNLIRKRERLFSPERPMFLVYKMAGTDPLLFGFVLPKMNYSWTLGGVLPEKLGRGVRPASQNPCLIYDQNLRFSLPYL